MSKDFIFTWEQFINGFDSLEEIGKWDKDKYGEMEAFCENMLISIVCYFISVDKKITLKEVNALNQLFGFDYSIDEIENICETMDEELEDYVEAPKQLIDIIADANIQIAEAFKELIIDSCEEIIKADDIDCAEEAELNELIANLRG